MRLRIEQGILVTVCLIRFGLPYALLDYVTVCLIRFLPYALLVTVCLIRFDQLQ